MGLSVFPAKGAQGLMADEMRGIYGPEPMLSVAVSSYNQLPLLKLAFESYSRQTLRNFEVVVADDGSDDGTLDWIRGLRTGFAVRMVTHVHDGYGLVRAWNEAAAEANGERILFTNADVLHSPGSFEAHLKAGGTGAGLVAGIAAGGVPKLTVERVAKWAEVEELRREHPACGNFDFANALDPNFNSVGVWSSSLSVPTDAFRDVGGFSARFDGKWGCEDYDLVDRMAREGVTAEWVRSSMAFHVWHLVAKHALDMEGCEVYGGFREP